MAELGYFEPVPGIYGTPNPATDSSPEQRAALQESFAQKAIALAQAPGHIPLSAGYGANAPQWATQPGGPTHLPVIGWTAQNAGNRPAFYPYDAEGIGTVPDWTADPNPAAAGSYDMNVVVSPYPPNSLNRAPIGLNDGDFFQYMGVAPDPDFSGYDDSTQDEY